MPNGIQPQQNTRYANQFRRNTDNFIVVECDTNVVEAKCMDEIVDDEIVECKETIKNQKKEIAKYKSVEIKNQQKIFKLLNTNRELKVKCSKTRSINANKKTEIDKLTSELKRFKKNTPDSDIIIKNKKLIDKITVLNNNYKIMNDNREEWKVYSSKLQKTIDELRKEIKTIHENRDFLKKLHQ